MCVRDAHSFCVCVCLRFYVCSAHPVTKDMIASPSAAAALALSSSAMQASFSSSSITATADTARAAVNYKGPSS